MASDTSNPKTLGDVLPASLQSEYSSVLDVSLEEAMNIAVYDEPSTSGLSEDDLEKIDEIYELYSDQSSPDESGGSAYWNKSEDDNKAYWSKNS